MKDFFSFLGRLLGLVGKAGKAWGTGIALLPHLAQIIMFVQALRGQGTGADKRKQAIELFHELLVAEGIITGAGVSPALHDALTTAVGECVDAAIALDKVIAAIKAELWPLRGARARLPPRIEL
jgi:hypothetical protein